MLGASLYVIVCSTRNRIARRLRRLREPRYLLGAAVGAAYFYLAVFARMFGSAGRRGGRRAPPADVVIPALSVLGPPLGGMALFSVGALCWVLPLDASLLAFSEAEVQFLFPAPLTRRQLIIHRLMRSQMGLLVASLVPALLYPSGSMWMRARTALAMWVLLVTGKVYFTGVALARGHWRSTDRRARRLAWMPMILTAGGVGVVGAAAASVFGAQAGGVGLDLLTGLSGIVTTGASYVVLWPFVALATPLFAASLWQFAVAFPPALAVLALAVGWVLWSDGIFQDEVSSVAARQTESRKRPRSVLRVRSAGWTLGLSGRTETLFFWKNAMQTLRRTGSVGPLVALGGAIIIVRLFAVGARGVGAALGILAGMVAAFSTFFGPQLVRTDLRSDLRHLELLKTWPVKSAEVIRGEMLWPGCVVTGISWVAVSAAAVLASDVFPQWSGAWRLSATVAAMLVVPALVFSQYTVHAAATVWFPAWVPLDDERARGLETMGQRIILFGGIILALSVLVAPGAIAGGLVAFVLSRLIGAASLVLAGVICVAVVAVEIVLATEALGSAYDRVDLSAVERAE